MYFRIKVGSGNHRPDKKRYQIPQHRQNFIMIYDKDDHYLGLVSITDDVPIPQIDIITEEPMKIVVNKKIIVEE